jgi:class 3 adenylate cyclase
MSTTQPPAGPGPSQRTLAAIVFTDVVGFSARMNRDEVATLKLLQRDFAEMRRLCAEHEGLVLKTTGDGLLLTFTSAVQAVACALAMQRQFAAEAKDPAAGDVLQHRIGIHLGDVLVQDQDVMGDGVNIASRLQSEAEPGGICISQTVYDVVKNKLKMHVVSLGPRDLKNIAQAVPAYRLLLEAQALDSSTKSIYSAPGAPPAAATGNRKLFIAVGAIAGLALLAVAGVILSRHTPPPTPTPVLTPPVAATVAPTPTPPPVTKGSEEADPAKRKELLQAMHQKYLDNYDFDGLVAMLREKGEGPSARPGAQMLLRGAEQLVTLKEWLDITLRRYNRQRPLLVHDLSGDTAKDTHVFLAPDRRFMFVDNGTVKPRDLSELKPTALGSIIVSAIQEMKQTPRDAVVGAQAFARMYALPAMTEALTPAKLRREKESATK